LRLAAGAVSTRVAAATRSAASGNTTAACAARSRSRRRADIGSLQHGEACYEGELLRLPEVKSRDEEPRTRSTWRRIDADAFEVTRERREDEQWKTLLSVVYRRAGPAGPDHAN
jgi:hypothetical protein